MIPTINRDLEFCYEYLHILNGKFPVLPILLHLAGHDVTVNTHVAYDSPGAITIFDQDSSISIEHVLILYVKYNA